MDELLKFTGWKLFSQFCIMQGDLAAFKDGNGIVLGIADSPGILPGSIVVVFGDSCRHFVEFSEDVWVQAKEHFSPQAGRLIGSKFDSLAACRQALEPYRLKGIHHGN